MESISDSPELNLLQGSFRASFAIWASEKFGGEAGGLSDRAMDAFVGIYNTLKDYSSSPIFHKRNEAIEAARDSFGSIATQGLGAQASWGMILAASRAADATDGAATQLFDSVSADLKWLERKSEAFLHSERILSQRLWVQDVRHGKARLNQPAWAEELWSSFKKSRQMRLGNFGPWVRWYESLLVGRKRCFFDAKLNGEAERGLILRVLGQDNLFWMRQPHLVNEAIIRWIEEAIKASAPSVPRPETSSEIDDATTVLTQRPSSHRFDWRSDRLEAQAVREPPFDPILADAITLELREKAAEALASLTRNHADELVTRSVSRLLSTLRSEASEIPEGLLLMRAHTVAAHSRSYSDPANERERNIRAMLDDISASLESLIDCYPGIRQINANRLALNMQAEDAVEVDRRLRELSQLAEASPLVGQSASGALSAGVTEFEEIEEKLLMTTSVDQAADYVRVRGEIVASRLLDVTNFVSALLLKAGGEVVGLGSDTWREIRKSWPKAMARGLSKGTEKAVEFTVKEAAILALAYCVAGPWAAVAVLVPRLRGHAQKGESMKREIDKKLDGG